MGMSDQMRHPRPSVVELHIGELVLDGFPPLDRAQLGVVVQQELTRLFAERGVPAGLANGGEAASLDGGEFHVAPGSNAQAIGAQIAQVVYGGLSR
jgi:hypothetical protein